MFTVNGNPITATEMQVLEELRRQCTLNGLSLFKVFKMSGANNIMTNCPFHKDGQERKPSFGISVVDMSCHCFTCGWAGSLDTLISGVFGYDDEGDFGTKWLAKNFISLSVETRKPLELDMSRSKITVVKHLSGFTEEELDKYRYYHPYMYKRGLTDEIIESFDVGYDCDTECITFPVFNLDKTPAFIARRSVKSKFFNYPEGVQKPVYCAERFVDVRYSEAIICESIINTLTCWKHSKPSVSLIGTGTEFQYEVLRKLPVRKYILAMDNDVAGRRASKRLQKELMGCKLVTFLDIPVGMDVNDCDENFHNLVEYY